jgi:Acetylornithine deacetylase/Succinyl-diaminopimelate desuccinylase and related deacylases
LLILIYAKIVQIKKNTKYFAIFVIDMTQKEYTNDAIDLLKHLIATPSVSRHEKEAADIIAETIVNYGLEYQREANNVWITDKNFDTNKPTLLLNAHIDTVKPVDSWTRNPFMPTIENNVLYGLGSNDCGGGLVSLLQVFRYLSAKPQKYNVIYLASAEEEISGKNGISMVLPLLPKIDIAIVGEPTGMQPAIAEKGLMVIDLITHGKSGHAARNEGINAIYEALDDLMWIRDYKFKKISDLLGPTKMTVTVVNAGTQHNVIPDKLTALIDVRTNEFYKNEDVCKFIQKHCKSEIKAHSYRLNSSHISPEHPLTKRCIEMGMKPFGSPTLSDQALMNFPSFKLGPGESSRSHSADEFIEIGEIENAIKQYIQLLDGAII